MPTTADRLRRSDIAGPGITRRRRGRGWEYLEARDGRVEDAEILTRIEELVIPPAWQEVWICPYPGGHIQATGIDQKGRKQYLYHPAWRQRRDAQKFDDMVEFARRLPDLRDRVSEDLARGDMGRERVLAAAVRLLDRGFFRIGSEDYAVKNQTYGLATMKRRHCRLDGDVLLFDYPAKHSKRRIQAVIDPEIAEILKKLKSRRGGGDELLAYKPSPRGGWADVKSTDINEYLKDATGHDMSAKDFRTWGATVWAAVALGVSGQVPATKTAQKRMVVRAVKEVAYYLGNTPAVARASYIDPRVIDRFQDGMTISGVLTDMPEDAAEQTAIQGPVEDAVLDLVTGGESDLLERVPEAA